MADSLPANFPTAVEDFETDDRISWSRADNKWILEETNGNEWEFDVALKRWVQTVDKDLLEQQSKAYRIPGVDESEDAQEEIKSKKRKHPDSEQDGKPAKKKELQNTAVYVTSLPLDATKEEVTEVFSRYGLIAESIDTEEKRVRLYTDKDGNFTGEALIVYFRPESVGLAINMLDDTDFNFRQGPQGRMRVKEADMSFKKNKGDEDGVKKAQHKPSKADKDSKLRYEKKQAQKLADWGDEGDDEPAHDSSTSGPAFRWARTVVLKHMFTLKELEEDPEAEEDIRDDISEEASKFGDVEVVWVFNQEPDGVVVVRFSEPAQAQECMKAFNGRAFDGRIIEATIPKSKERYRRKREDQDKENARLRKFANELEAGKLVKNHDNHAEKNGSGKGVDNSGE